MEDASGECDETREREVRAWGTQGGGGEAQSASPHLTGLSPSPLACAFGSTKGLGTASSRTVAAASGVNELLCFSMVSKRTMLWSGAIQRQTGMTCFADLRLLEVTAPSLASSHHQIIGRNFGE